MKKLLIGQGILILALLVFLAACDVDGPTSELPPLPTPPPGGMVATPSIAPNPNRNFDPSQITITLATTTPDAIIYFTLDGSSPANSPTRIQYDPPLILTVADVASYTQRGVGHEYLVPADVEIPGFVRMGVIAIREGFTNSFITWRNFQIIPHEQIAIADGEHTGTGRGYYGYIEVTLVVENGEIMEVTIADGYSGSLDENPIYWPTARAHAELFMTTMNSVKFDALTGATISSAGIRVAAMDALGLIE